ncbi:hypothetical protein BC831DRAFT_246820 [Entophlyctis helioformis]|nr:hypothetical protein BC831DRAFT_246820 [Entophlyctis helioformis]
MIGPKYFEKSRQTIVAQLRPHEHFLPTTTTTTTTTTGAATRQRYPHSNAKSPPHSTTTMPRIRRYFACVPRPAHWPAPRSTVVVPIDPTQSKPANAVASSHNIEGVGSATAQLESLPSTPGPLLVDVSSSTHALSPEASSSTSVGKKPSKRKSSVPSRSTQSAEQDICPGVVMSMGFGDDKPKVMRSVDLIFKLGTGRRSTPEKVTKTMAPKRPNGSRPTSAKQPSGAHGPSSVSQPNTRPTRTAAINAAANIAAAASATRTTRSVSLSAAAAVAATAAAAAAVLTASQLAHLEAAETINSLMSAGIPGSDAPVTLAAVSPQTQFIDFCGHNVADGNAPDVQTMAAPAAIPNIIPDAAPPIGSLGPSSDPLFVVGGLAAAGPRLSLKIVASRTGRAASRAKKPLTGTVSSH